MYTRACELPNSELVMIVGEGNFHQIHGGVATNKPPTMRYTVMQKWKDQYFKIRRKRYMRSVRRPEFIIGHAPQQALQWLAYSAKTAVEQFEDVGSQ